MNQQPVLSIDVAKGKSVAAAFLSYGEIFRKPFSFPHSPSGLSSLLHLLSELQEHASAKPHVVLEATGNYSKPLVSFFYSNGYPVVVLNPLATHQLKKKAIRKVKTDPIDAYRIAQVFYLEQVQALPEIEEQIAELRVLCRQLEHWKQLYDGVRIQFRAVLDLLFPGYDKLFQKVCNPTSLRLLSQFPTPHAVLSASKDELLEILMQNRRGRAWNEKKLNQLLDLAANSLPDLQAVQAHLIVLRHYLPLLTTYQEAIQELEKQMIKIAEQLPVTSLLRSIPGVGPLTSATILAEIGDIKRFPTVKQLTAFAGLDSSVFESGTFRSKQNRISKRGSAYLRTALYQATVCGISKQIHGPRNPVLTRYYQQKLAEGKPAKTAIVATSHKLLRIIFGIWRSQVPFQADC